MVIYIKFVVYILIINISFSTSENLDNKTATVHDKDVNSLRKTCSDVDCKNDGNCIEDVNGTSFCSCRQGSSGDFCQTVDACEDPKFKYCKGLNGTCVLGDKYYTAKCECNNGKKFDGNLYVCRDTCEDDECKNGAICTADVNGNTFCQCRQGSRGDFCEVVNACDDPKFMYCRGDNGTCALGDKSHGAVCQCNGSKEFDGKLNECRENKCKSTCGNENDVICVGNPFAENVNCTCNDKSKDFVSRDKLCKVNMCKVICGNADGVICQEDQLGHDVFCDCKDKDKIFLLNEKICHSLCDPNPCWNGAQCITLEKRGFSCKCKDIFIGPFCNETSHIPRKPCKTNHLYVAILGALTGILLIILLIIGIILCQRSFAAYQQLNA